MQHDGRGTTQNSRRRNERMARVAGQRSVSAWIAAFRSSSLWPLLALNLLLVLGTIAFPIGYLFKGEWWLAFYQTLWGPCFVIYTIAGAMILIRYPKHGVGRVLLAIGTTCLFNQFVYFYGIWGIQEYPGSLPHADVIVQLGTFYPLSLWLALVEVQARFPSGQIGRWWQIPRIAGLIGALVASIYFLTAPAVMGYEFGMVPNPFEVTNPDIRRVLDNLVSTNWTNFKLLLAANIVVSGGLLLRLRSPQLVERQQVKWISWIVVLVSFLFALHVTAHDQNWFTERIGWAIATAWGFGLLLLPLGIVIAILRFRLFDIDFLFNRTVLYSVLAAIGIVSYLLLAAVFAATLSALGIAQSRQAISSVLATAMIAALFQPLRDVLRGVANRRLFGDRNDPAKAIQRLGFSVQTALVADETLPIVAQTIVDSIRSPGVEISLFRTSEPNLVATAGSVLQGAFDVLMPLTFQNQMLGEMRVCERTPGEPFNGADQDTIASLARQTAIIGYALLLNADLQGARASLVTARENERVRLRRDLHDGLGSQLATFIVQSGSVRRWIRSDPERAEAELIELQSGMREAIGDMRRLVNNLRPPALDELGLVTALQTRFATFPSGALGDSETPLRVTFTASSVMDDLSAAESVAIYRIVEEAMTNVVRHARASKVRVILEKLESGAVRLSITDDGQGIAADAPSGIGIESMRERAMEVGGTFSIGSNVPRGTRIDVTIPIYRVDNTALLSAEHRTSEGVSAFHEQPM